MAPKYNVYIRKENVETWESLQSGSDWVNDQLERTRHERPIGEDEKRFIELQQRRDELQAELEMRAEQASMISAEISNINARMKNPRSLSKFFIDRKNFISRAREHAVLSCNQQRIFGSVRNNTHYRFNRYDEKNGEVHITNLKNSRRNITLALGPSSEGWQKAIMRLQSGLGKVETGGGLLAVPAEEEALIAIHPDLWVQGDWISYIPESKFEFEDGHASIVHCKRCGKNDFNKIYGPQHDPYDEPDSISYCQQCGHLAVLDLDFPDAADEYRDWAEQLAVDQYIDQSRGVD